MSTAKKREALSTREQILAAARTVLQHEGAAALSTRLVAQEAGVNLSLIHYHFDSREGLLLAVLERMDQELLDRQRRMYRGPAPSLADQWQQAIDFYREDLRSGYVRSLMELTGHGYSNPALASRLREVLKGWRELIRQVAAEALPRLGIDAMTPEEVAAAVVTYWYGMEMQHVLGVPEEEGHLFQTTQTLGRLLERLESEGGRRQQRPELAGKEDSDGNGNGP
jgi:AcrR family transcriptional regulator